MLQILVVIIAYLTFVCLQNVARNLFVTTIYINEHAKRSKHMHALLCVVFFRYLHTPTVIN